MAAVKEKIEAYAQKHYILSEDAQWVGFVQDEGGVVILGFQVKRGLITHIGYLSTGTRTPAFYACFNVVCELMEGQAVVNGGLPQRERIAELLSDDGRLEEEDMCFAVMAELALRYACSSHAEKKVG